MFDQDAFHATVACDGDSRLLDPAKLNRINSLMTDRAAELSIENTIIESYAHTREYAGQEACVEEPLVSSSGNRSWHEMLNIAKRLLDSGSTPTEAELKKAVDRCYFAMYHALCHSNGRALAGNFRERRPERLVQGLHGHGREHHRGTVPAVPAPSLR